MKEGRKERRKDGRKEGKKEGKMEGRKEGSHLNSEWITMHSEQPHHYYLFPIIITVVESRTMRCTGHIARREVTDW